MTADLTREEILSLPAGPELDAAVSLHVFSDDLTANTDERIATAVLQWRSERTIGSVLALDKYTSRHVQDVDSRFLWLWKNREQADRAIGCGLLESLETHVAAYRAKPSPFSTDIALCFAEVVPKIGAMTFAVSREKFSRAEHEYVGPFLEWTGYFAWGVNSPREPVQQKADTTALAICRAAVAATWKGGE